MQIKICGITTLREIEFVNELKPDYIGLVFAESKRKVNEEKAFQLCKYLNKEIKTVAVFRNNSFEEIKNVLEKVPIDILQLHGNETEYMVKRIKDIFKGEVWRGINYKEYSEEKLNLVKDMIMSATKDVKQAVDKKNKKSEDKEEKDNDDVIIDLNKNDYREKKDEE